MMLVKCKSGYEKYNGSNVKLVPYPDSVYRVTRSLFVAACPLFSKSPGDSYEYKA